MTNFTTLQSYKAYTLFLLCQSRNRFGKVKRVDHMKTYKTLEPKIQDKLYLTSIFKRLTILTLKKAFFNVVK